MLVCASINETNGLVKYVDYVILILQVETIGDAYMVVGGVPIPVSSHAERVANFALGMIIAAKEVTNPITGDPIQVRIQAVYIYFLN